MGDLFQQTCSGGSEHFLFCANKCSIRSCVCVKPNMNPRLAHDNKQAEDLSGTPLSSAKNPFDFILESCNDNSVGIRHSRTVSDNISNNFKGAIDPNSAPL